MLSWCSEGGFGNRALWCSFIEKVLSAGVTNVPSVGRMLSGCAKHSMASMEKWLYHCSGFEPSGSVIV